MFKKKTPKFEVKPDASSTDCTITWTDTDPASNIWVANCPSGTLSQSELQNAQSYYNQMASQLSAATYSNGTAATTYLTAPTQWYVSGSAQTAYTYAMPYNVPPRETEEMPPVPKIPIEKDPEIGVGIDAFFAEKKRQEALK